MSRFAIGLGWLLLGGVCLAQTSASFSLEEHVLNAGGAPGAGIELASASFHMTLASIGDAVAMTGLASASFQAELGFDVAFLPPGEVAAGCSGLAGSCLVFLDPQTLVWPPEKSAGVYNLYRDRIQNLTSLNYGGCASQHLPLPMATVSETVAPGDGYFYLVTVENRLGEEGTKGFRHGGIEREGTVCP
jgi:hypothetical protein